MTANQISFYKARNEKKHYKRQDKETKRHNLETEGLGKEQNILTKWYNEKMADIGYTNASANLTNAAANTKNAATNAKNADLREQELLLEHVKEYGDPISSTQPVSYRLKVAQTEQAGAQTGLVVAQTGTEGERTKLVQAETEQTGAQKNQNWARAFLDTTSGLAKAYMLINGIVTDIGEVRSGDVLITTP